MLVQCDAASLMLLEQTCRAFALPAPQLSLVQETVRDSIRQRFPGAQLGIRSWPSLMRQHEKAAEVAEQWHCEPTIGVVISDAQKMAACTRMCETLKDKIYLSEQRAAASRQIVAKLHQALDNEQSDQVEVANGWLETFSRLSSCVNTVSTGWWQPVLHMLW